MKKSFTEVWVLLLRNSVRDDLMPGEWARIEEEGLEKLREAYR